MTKVDRPLRMGRMLISLGALTLSLSLMAALPTVIAMAQSPSGGTNLLADPSFESATDAPWVTAFAGSASVPSQWPVSTPPDGSRAMTLIGYPGGGVPAVSQDVGAATPGAVYDLRFYFAARSDSHPGTGCYPCLSALPFTASLVVHGAAGDTVLASQSIDPNAYQPGIWTQAAFSGTANSTGDLVVKFVGSPDFRDNMQSAIDMVMLNGTVTCSGGLPAGTYPDVVVASGQGCRIDSSTILGNLTSSSGAGDIAVTNTTIRGNLSIDSFSGNSVVLGWAGAADVVSGNVSVTNSTTAWGIVVGDGSPTNTIGGALMVQGNTSHVGRINGNTIQGDMTITQNSFTGNALAVELNHVGGTLTFSNNSGVLWFGGWFQPGDTHLFPNSAGVSMVCLNNSGFTTSGNNTAPSVIGCNGVTLPPTVTPNVAGQQGQNGWYVSDVSVSWNVSDPSAQLSPGCQPTTINSNTPGVTLTCSATNAGGTATRSVAVMRDATSPVVQITPQRPPDFAGWYNFPVTFTAADTAPQLSGATCTPQSTQYTGPTTAGTAISAQCTSGAGLIGATSYPFKFDATPPQNVAGTARPPDANGWYNHAVPIAFTATFSASGGSCSSTTYSGPDSAGTSVLGTCTSGAGLSNNGSFALKYDATPPTITFAGNAGTYTVDQSVNITCAAAASVSGVGFATCPSVASGPAYSFALGANTFSASATSGAGLNTQAATSFVVKVTYDGLCNLTAQFSTKAGVANGLCAKLNAAQTSAAQGDQNAKAGQVNAYLNQLSAQSGKALTAAQVSILSKLASSL